MMKEIEISLPDTQDRAILREDWTWYTPERRDAGILSRRLNRDHTREYLSLYANAEAAALELGSRVITDAPEDLDKENEEIGGFRSVN